MISDPTFWIWLVVAFIGIVISALCSGLETGIYILNRVRLVVRAGRGQKRALILEREFERPSRLLTTLLVGTNAGNYFGSLGIAGILNLLAFNTAAAVAINALILIPVFFVFAPWLLVLRAGGWAPQFFMLLAAKRRLSRAGMRGAKST